MDMVFYCPICHKDTDNCSCEKDNLRARVIELEAQLAKRNSEIGVLKIAHKAHEDSNLKMLAKLKQQAFALAETEALEMAHGERIEKLTKQLLLAKDALSASDNLLRELPNIGGIIGLAITENNAETLSTISDSKMVECLVLCDAEPVAYTNEVELDYAHSERADNTDTSGAFWKDFSEDSDVPLYASWRPK